MQNSFPLRESLQYPSLQWKSLAIGDARFWCTQVFSPLQQESLRAPFVSSVLMSQNVHLHLHFLIVLKLIRIIRLFTSLFGRNFGTVCSQAWLSVRNSVWGRFSTNSKSATKGLPLPLGRGVCETKPKNGRSRPRKPLFLGFSVLRGGLRPWSRKGPDHGVGVDPETLTKGHPSLCWEAGGWGVPKLWTNWRFLLNSSLL